MKISTAIANCKKTTLAFIAILFCLITGIKGWGQTTQTYATPGTYTFTVPFGVSSITVSTWGGGGAGGGVNGVTGTPKAGGGGEGGSFVRGTIGVTSGATYTIVVGSGGTGVIAANGGSGLASSFSVSGGGATLFNAIGGGGGNAGGNFGAGGNAANVGNIVSGSTTSNFYGGNGGTATNASTASSGGGGGSAGAGGGGGNGGSPLTAGTAGAGSGAPTDAGVAGSAGRGSMSDNNGIDANGPGGGGSGGRNANNNTDYRGGNGGNGQVNLTYTQLTYKSSILSVSAASTAAWCPGETRNVQVTIKNTGTATWTDGTGGTPVINVGVKWNLNGANWTDYYIRVTAGNLAPNVTATYTLPLTASNNIGSGYTTPLASGTNNLIFDVVYEGVSWFGDNGGGVGPGNSKFTTSAITINALPSITSQSTPTQTRCKNVAAASMSVTATGTGLTYQWYSNTTASNSGGTLIGGATLASFTPSTTMPGTLYYYCVVSGMCTPPATSNVSGAIIVNDNGTIALTSANNIQTLCLSNAGSFTPITYSVGGNATGASITAGSLPAGINVSFSSGVFTIGGSPTASGTYNYTVSATGSPCVNPSLTGTITVNDDGSITLSSASGTDNQNVCAGIAITNITYNIGGYGTTGATINWTSGTPSGISGNYSGGVFTISGTCSTPGTYAYTVTTTGPCTNNFASGSINVNTSGTVTRTSASGTDAQTVCYNSPITDITYLIGGDGSGATVTGLPAGVTGSYDAGTSIFTITGAPNNVSGTFNYTVTATGSSCTNLSANGTINVNANLVAGTVATTPQTICYNTAPSGFTSSALPTGGTGSYTYQWQSSPDNITFTNIGGATATTYTSGVLTATTYFRRNETSGTCGTVSSNVITVTVNANLVAGTVATTPQTICYNTAPAAFTSTTLPTGGTGSYTYQWQSSAALAGPYNSIGGATGTTYAPGALTATTYYRRNETSGTCGTVSSNVITITVYAVLTGGTVGSNQTICYNTAPAAFTSSVLATGADGSYTYQWQSSPDNVTFTNIGGATGTTYTTGALTATTYFRRVASSATCGTSANSNVITITVNANLTSGAVGSDQTICYNTAPVAFTSGSLPTGGTGSYTYQWQSSPDNVTFTNIGAATGTTYAPGVLTTTTYYRRNATSGTCGTVSSNVITVTVRANLLAGTVGSNQTICYNTTPAAFTSTTLPTGGTGSYTYQWQSSAALAGPYNNIAGATAATYTSGALTATTYFRRNETSGTCGTVSSNVITVTVYAVLTGGTVATTPQTICYNTAPSAFTSSALPTGADGIYTYQWQSSPDNVTFTNIVGATSTTYTSGALTATTYFRRNATSTTCGTTASSNVITVNVRANLVAGTVATTPQTICYNTAPSAFTSSALPTGGTGSYAYQWQSSPDNITFTNIGGATATTYTSGVLTATTYFRRNETSGTCGTVSSNVITVNVRANLVAGTVATTPQTICYNTAPSAFTSSALPTGGTGSYTYQWQSAAALAGPYNNIAGATAATYTSGALTATTYFRRNETSGTCGTVSSNVITVTVYNVLTGGTVGSDQTICASTSPAGFTSSALPTGADGSYTYQWQSSADNVTFNNIGGATGTTYAPGVLIATTYYRRNATSATCGTTASSNVITITVNPLPSGTLTATETSGNTNNDNIICAGETVTFTFSNSTYGSYIFKVNGFTKQTGTSNTYSTNTLLNNDQVTVDVANSFNCGATFGPIVITVIALPTPTLSADKASICPGDMVTFTAGPVVIGNSYNFKLNGSSVQSGPSNTYSTTTFTAADNPVTVDVTNSNGCTATSAPVSVTINAVPSGSLTATETSGTANDNTICAGSNVDFTATPLVAGYTYNFKVNGTSMQNTGSNVYSTTALTNGQVVTVDVTNGSGCTASFGPSQVITVVDLPTGALTATETSGTTNNDNIICAGSLVTFTATSGYSNYAFYLKGTGTALYNGSLNAYSTTSLVNGDYLTVVVTGTNGCTYTFTSPVITVNPLPAGTLAASANPICFGDNVDFTATAGFSNYNFKVNAITVQNGSSNTYSTTSLVDGDKVTVRVSNNGCGIIFNSLTITVNPLPIGTLTPVENSGVAANDSIICAGANVDFTATLGFNNYNFKLNGTTVQYSAANIYSTNTLSDGDVVTVEVTNASGCFATFNTATITVNNLPAVTPITGTFEVCVGNITVLADATTGVVNVWSSSDDAIATVDASGNVTGVAAGTATIFYTVTNVYGCSSTVSKDVTVNDLPVVEPITGNLNVCTNAYTQLGDVTLGGVWSSGDPAIVSINSSGLAEGNAEGTATISYTVTDANGCTTTVTADVNVALTPTVKPITTTAPSFDVCVGSTIKLKDGTSGGVWSSGDLSIATISSTGVVTGVAAGNVDIHYIINTVCLDTVEALQTITVHALPTAFNVTGGGAYCTGGSGVDISLPGSESGVNYQLYKGASAVGSPVSGTGSAISFGNQTAIGTYTVKATNVTTGCTSNMTGSVPVSINPLPTAFTVTGGGAYCSGGSGVVIGLSGSQSGVDYQLYNGVSPAGSPVSGTGSAISFGNQTAAGTYTVVATNTTTSCTNNMTGSVTVSINPLPIAYAVTGGGGYCSGVTGVLVGLSNSESGVNYQLYNGASPAGSPVSGTGSAISFGNQTAAGTYTVVATNTTTSCTNNMTGSVMVSINPLPTAFNVTGGGAYCSGGSGVAIGLFGSQSGVDYQLYNGASPAGSPVSGTGSAISFGLQTAAGTYTVVATNTSTSCTNNMTGSVTVTINPLPTATISGPANVCKNDPTAPVVTFTGANGTAPYTFTYTVTGTPGNQTVTSVGNTATVTILTTTVTSYTYTLVSVTDNSTTMCSQNISGQSVAVMVNDIPSISLLSYNSTMCQSDIQSLTATSTGTPITQTASATSVTNFNLDIPDATGFFFTTPGEVNTSLNISAIPASAVVTNISVKLNIVHTYDGDLNFNIKAPNGNILNLVNRDGGNGQNFTNTIVSMIATTAIPNNGAPYTGTYKPDAQNGIGPTGNKSNVISFSQLTSILNGNWTLYAEDAARGDDGYIHNWSITIDYQIPSSNPVTWSPLTDLYTDAGATTAYAGQSLTTVYVKPSSSGTKVYTATATNAASCTNSVQATIMVAAPPVVTISADYCAIPGKVLLTASSGSGITYKWSTGQTTDTIQVDIAGTYIVTETNAQGCKGSASINVAQELVTNGNFESGDNGFTTLYTPHTGSYYVYSNPATGLWPEGDYAVDISAYSPSTGVGYHPSFHGRDHTSGNGKFMMINGSTALKTIWEETVPVLPNTTYYFSAWGMNLNPTSPAQLQFAVNGVQSGTIADLNLAPKPTTEGQVNLANWIRFYGTWTSGPTTTSAVINIVNLNTVAGGNDFGLDDISFGTLSTFIILESAPGTDAQTVCVNSPITNIVYNVGNGSASGPTVTGLPSGVTSVFAGDKLTISGTPTVAGNYTYTITTTGCSPYSVTGKITVNQQKLTVSSGSPVQTVCINTAIANIIYTAAYTDGNPVTDVTVLGLPSGITASMYNTGTKTITISGTPTVAGIFKDTVITIGSCKADTAYGTITVQEQTIALTSGTVPQTVCINKPISNIVYTVGGTGTGASITWSPSVPTGISSNYAGNSFVISGTPTVSGTFTYTVTTTGTCSPAATAMGTITINPTATMALTSAPGTDAQTICINDLLTDIVYTGSATVTDASITSGALPTGVSGIYDIATNKFTISGTPSVAGIFNYTITATGTCASTTISGTITVQEQTIDLASGSASPTACLGSTLNPIVFDVGGSATGASISWSPSTPVDISGNYSPGTFTISSGVLTELGTFNYTITTSGTCSPAATISGTITVNNGTVPGTIASFASKCSGDNITFNLNGKVGNVVQWESSANGSAPWTIIANTTTSQNYNPITAPIQVRALVKSGSCNALYSNVATVTIHNYWTGTTDENWETASNWSDNQKASGSCSMYTIPGGTPNEPQLTVNTTTVENITMGSGASVDLNGKKFIINGTYTGTGTLTGNTASELTIKGNAGTVYFTPNIYPGATTNNYLKTLTVIGGSSNITIGDSLNIAAGNSGTGYGTVAVTGGTLNGNDNLILKSDVNGTARVDYSTGTITGNVTAERYIPPLRAWRFLSVPFSSSTQTIRDAWQEGVNNYTLDYSQNLNPHPGFGTHITGDNISTKGFDLNTTVNPSMKVWDSTIGSWNASEPWTINTTITDHKAYCLFVRGSRAVDLSQATSATPYPTVLRIKGVLNQTGLTAAKTYPGGSGNVIFVGNPYASSINIYDLIHTRASGFQADKFWVWDPKMTGNNNVGGYVSYNDGVMVPPMSPSYLDADSALLVESGQAFMVQLNTGSTSASLNFKELDKVATENNVFGFAKQKPAAAFPVIYTNLMLPTENGLVLADGVGAGFDNKFSAAVDDHDSKKLWNFDEKLTLVRNDTTLAIEFRPMPVLTDTLFYRLYLRNQPYVLQIFAQNSSMLPMRAWLVDKYLKTEIEVNLSDTALYNFAPVADANGKLDTSSYRNRFMLVFKRQFTGTPVPVTKVVNESNPNTTGNTNSVAASVGSVHVYPNPATTDKVMLQFGNMEKGKYEVTVYSTKGQKLSSRKIEYSGGTNVYTLPLNPSWAAGVYTINIANEDSKKAVNLKLVISR